MILVGERRRSRSSDDDVNNCIILYRYIST